MRGYKRRVWLGAVMVLSLLAGACAFMPVLADSTRMVALSTPAPDLVIEAITWSPEIPSIGDTVTFTVTIKNRGSGQAGSSRVACYVDGTYQTSTSVGPIDADAMATKAFTWTAESGSHTIKAVADSDGSVAESDETNNTITFAFSVLAPDLVIEAITWSPENPSIGDQVTIVVTVKNQGNSRARFSRVGLNIDGLSRGYNEVQIIDAGANVTTTFAWTARAGLHTFKAVADLLNHVNESDELNNEKSVTCSTASPDLIINTVTWSPATISENTTVTFTVTIKNQGIGKADYSRLAYYIDDVFHSSVHINPVNAGATVKKTFTWTAEAGSHTFKAVADFKNSLVESDETNNGKTITLPTLAPDLIIQSITWSPSTLLLNHRTIITVTVKNQGKTAAGSSRLYLYIDDYYKWQLEVPAIGAGATVAKTLAWTIKADPHVIRAVADAENCAIEGDESNNTKTVTLAVSPPSTSDLIIQDIVWSPANPAKEETVAFTVTIKNQSSVMAYPSYVAYYIDDTYQDSAYVNQLDPRTTVTKTFIWTAESGSHTFKAVADHDNSVTESNENNNEKAVIMLTTAADLIIGDITWSPVSPAIGDAVTFMVTVRNRGNFGAGPCVVTYYIDGASRGYHAIQEVAANATVTTTFTWTAQSGSHVIRIVADGEYQVAESDESNNEKQVTLPAPDLIIRDITWSPANPSENTTVTFAVTVENQGAGRAGSSNVYLYVDDFWEGYRSIPEIEAGATLTRTFTYTAQKDSHIIRATADGENRVTESDESNNEESVTLMASYIPETAPEPALASKPDTIAKTGLEEGEPGVHLQNFVTYVPLGEDIVFDFRAVNPATNPVMMVELVMQVPPGTSVVSPEFVKGDEGRYHASYSVEPGNIQQIEVRVMAQEEGSFNILGDLSYRLSGDESALEHQILTLPVTVGTDETKAENQQSSHSPWKGFLMSGWFAVAVMVLVGAVVAFMLRSRQKGKNN